MSSHNHEINPNSKIQVDGIVKSPKSLSSVIPANPGSGPGQAPESRKDMQFWTPAFAGVTALVSSYERSFVICHSCQVLFINRVP
jgi:hypothetical protein